MPDVCFLVLCFTRPTVNRFALYFARFAPAAFYFGPKVKDAKIKRQIINGPKIKAGRFFIAVKIKMALLKLKDAAAIIFLFVSFLLELLRPKINAAPV